MSKVDMYVFSKETDFDETKLDSAKTPNEARGPS